MKLPVGLTALLLSLPGFCAEQLIELHVDYKTVNFANQTVRALAINQQIPGPTLHFQEGDHITLKVHNCLTEPTAVHWHGIILPWQMDGVAGITQAGIKPGDTFEYRFTALQSGTYWYHAHADLQEQQGMYGALLIDPQKAPRYHYDKDYVIVLSDWSNTHPDQILANLKKDGGFYSPRFPLQPSLSRFLHDYQRSNIKERQQLLNDYKMMQQMRMSIYDLADVAYDALLLNGQPASNPWTGNVTLGDTVRLRFIGAGGSTIFHVKLPHTKMQMIHVQGNDIEPYDVSEFSIAPGETYDVLVKIDQTTPQIIYAESADKVNAIYGALVTSFNQCVDYHAVEPFPVPPPVTQEMLKYGMMHHGHSMASGGHEMSTMMNNHANHQTPRKQLKSQVDKTKYRALKAAVATNDPDKPIHQTINMTLDGWMDRYIWFINGVPEHHAKPIPFEENQRYRIIFKNTSMMHHPMHIHGHWFILRKDQGAYDPLLHTIDIPPGATIIADVDTDVSGQWLFHCHLLYHMMSGMARVFQYTTLPEVANCQIAPQNEMIRSPFYNRPIVRVDEVAPIQVSMVNHPMAHPYAWYFSNDLNLGVDPFHNIQRVTFKGLYGPDYQKIELFINDAEINHGTLENGDLDITYWRLVDQFWAIKGGVNYFYRPSSSPYWQPTLGIEGTMPYFIETQARAYYHSGSYKLDIEFERDTQITRHFLIGIGIRSILASKTLSDDEIGSGLNQMRYRLTPYYRLLPGVDLFVEYEHEHDYGILKRLKRQAEEATIQNTITFGLALLF